MANSPSFKVSEGEDFAVIWASRLAYAQHKTLIKASGTDGTVQILPDVGGTGVPAFKIDGTTGTVSGIGVNDVAVWSKAAVDGAASTATAEHVVLRAPQQITVSAIRYIPDATLSSNDTNYATITVKSRDTAGGTATTVASFTTKTSGSGGTGDWTAFVSYALTLVAGTLTLTTGQILTVAISKSGSGVAVPAGSLQVDYVQN